MFVSQFPVRAPKFFPYRYRALLGILPSTVQACKSDCPMAATLLHQNRKRKNHEKIQTPIPGSTIPTVTTVIITRMLISSPPDRFAVVIV